MGKIYTARVPKWEKRARLSGGFSCRARLLRMIGAGASARQGSTPLHERIELLRDTKHGNKALKLAGQIVAYGGVDNLSNALLLKYMKERHKRTIVTYDLDREDHALKLLARADIEKNKNAFAIGQNMSGKKDIEGLLPDCVLSQIHSRHTALVQQATAENGDARKEACSRLKRLYFDAFKAEAQKGGAIFGAFYPIVSKINQALAEPARGTVATGRERRSPTP